MKNIKFFEDFSNSLSNPGKVHEGHEDHDLQNYMFFQNLHTLKGAIDELMELDPHEVDKILTDGHGWALDHIATSVDDVEEVYHFLSNSIEMGHPEGGHEESEHEEDDEDDDEEETEVSVMSMDSEEGSEDEE